MRAIIGPLATLFRWYSKRNLDYRLVEKKSPSDAPPVPIAHSWSASGKEGVDYHMNMALDPVISFQEFVEMLEDFGVVPHLIRRSNVKRAFRIACGGLTPYETRRTPNPHPEDLRYPQFCDLIVRVALAGFSRPEDHLEYPGPTEKLRAMMGVMQLRTCRPKHLRDFLDLLAKRSSSRGCRRTLYKWNYVDCEDVTATAENCITENGWWAYSKDPAPQYLVDILKEHDVATGRVYLPDWRHFHFPMLDMGCFGPEDCKHYRIVVRNRGAREVEVSIDVEGMPFGTWSYSEKPLASGIGRVIDVEVHGHKGSERIQEYLGEVRISAVDEDPVRGEQLETHTVPVYARFEPWALDRMKGCVHRGV
ncbi:hypothetical protein BSKO_13024 [Bryopsis sp. KO-2023]|nr:hypothetical protein BSKO_13024 [Bryopsis sp. KO-2023]